MPNSLHANLLLYSFFTIIPSAAAILWLLWLGLKRADLPQTIRIRTWSFVAFVVAAWYGGFSLLAVRGFFESSRNAKVPALPIAVFLPIIFGFWYAMRSTAIRKAVQALPLSWLIGVQAYR